MAFDGAINAYIGADTKSYEQAMNEIAASTQKAFQKAQDSAVNSSNRLVQMVGQVMAQLANNGQSLGQRLGNAYSTGLNLSLGEIQRIASRIGEKIPEPIRNGFSKLSTALNPFISSVQIASSRVVEALGNRIVSPVTNVWSNLFSKLNTKTDSFNNSFAGKLTNTVGQLSTKVSQGLGTGFQTMGSKAVSALTGIVSHTNRAASASTNLIQQVAGISLAYAAFNGIKTAIGGAITKSADFEAKLSSIKAVTGSSAETMAQFKDAAIKAGAETAFSASEAADAIEELSKAGVSTKDILAGGLTGALNLATAGELDLKSAAEIASTALNAL